MDLFDFDKVNENTSAVPLAEQLRPTEIQDFLMSGASRGPIQKLISVVDQTQRVPSFILWGPPGTGKTTFAKMISKRTSSRFIEINAVDTGAKKLKELGGEARQLKKYSGQLTVLFIDEIHRLNRAQQDILLPFTESGDLSLIGATTENPGYELNSALLSRARVIPLEKHSEEALLTLLKKAAQVYGFELLEKMDAEAVDWLIRTSDGDGRKILNVFEMIFQHAELLNQEQKLKTSQIKDFITNDIFAYDKSADEHYDTISAFIKSIRGSDPDAAIYYLARMLKGGEDPKFIARRLLILASEDIGNADPRALQVAVSGFDAVERIGLPEAAINLAQVTCYLASCPKSNKSYEALKKAQKAVDETGHLPIPKALRSAQTTFAKNQGYGEGYRYSHEGAKGYLAQTFLPEALKGVKFYEPTNRGFEKNISEYLDWMKKDLR